MDKVSENPFKNRAADGTPLMIVTALFVTLYLVSNIMAVKVIGLAGIFYFDAGTITFPFAYMLGDVLTELWASAQPSESSGPPLCVTYCLFSAPRWVCGSRRPIICKRLLRPIITSLHTCHA